MKKGTILYVGNFVLPDKGASANRVVSNGKIFTKLGYTVAYLGITRTERFSGIRPLDQELHMYEQAYPQGSKEWFLHMWSTRNIEAMQERYPDLCMVILYNVPYLLLQRVKALYQKTIIKVVYDCTEWTGVTEGSLPKRIVKQMDESFIRNRIHRVADGLIVISKRMEAQYAACKKMILLPPLIDLDDSIWHQKIEKEDERFEFCFAGILDGNKDSLDSIVKAFEKTKKEKSFLRIIGVTEEEFCAYYPQLKECLQSLKDHVLFMGTLSHRDTIRYVLNCDSYIFIRQSDRRNNAGFPTKFVESYSCGCDIITTNISDLKDYIQDETNGQMLNSTSAEEVKAAMLKAMQKNDRQKEKKLNDTFHYENYVEKVGKWMEHMSN